MARDFSKISPAVWQSKRFRGLSSDEARLAFLYLLTSQHQTNAGAFRLPPPYATHDLGWSLEDYQKALSELEEVGLIIIDRETEEVLVKGWFRHNSPMNRSHLKGVEQTILRIESESLRNQLDNDLSQVYFDRELSKPNTPSDPVNQQPETAQIVDLSDRTKRPNEYSREEFDKALRRNGGANR